ncbi:hypothetical protein JMJ77_0013216 [Colletotrichum scovillei]|uniref:Uncharacterized protein n=1 Tax=Colletotrichum scovillei TaxID=1209932 RepID=A0A9P7R7R8_9PEZI|nr:hypothetical protein JMJ77_0013216 [Colletotrichum scovillei]KAG7069510.1 hypothetical protein JMJ76_0003178 [Colletotrichum scovillei]KAG7073457.1 hypothetical protein JMJ78_0014431 [Colletotrichum scovillei]
MQPRDGLQGGSILFSTDNLERLSLLRGEDSSNAAMLGTTTVTTRLIPWLSWSRFDR